MRHIPGCDIRSFTDIDFDRELKTALEQSDEYDMNRWLFVPNTYTEYRYILGTRGTNPLICIGINPSTARPDALDPTLKSVQRIALNNGYDSFLMMNVYAQRATCPGDMEPTLNEKLHEQNCRAFRYVLSLSSVPSVWAAWGNLIDTRPYLSGCVGDFISIAESFHTRWYCCGPISRRGHPHHPLYLKSDAMLAPFDARDYLQTIRNTFS